MDALIPSALWQGKARRPMHDLQTALNLESFWRANLRILRAVMPHHSCSLMLGIEDYQPTEGRHHLVIQGQPDSYPVTSLSISRPFLAAHPRVKMYSYTEIAQEDPHACERRMEREREFWGWSQFVHLAFWNGPRPEAVLSIRRSQEQGDFLAEEREFLAFLHPMIDAGLRRLRLLEQERGRTAGLERFLSNLPLPILFLEDDGRLGFATQEAYDLCAAWNLGFKQARAVNARRCFRVPDAIVAGCQRLQAVWDRAAGGDATVGTESERVEHPEIPRLVAKIDMSQPFRGAHVRPGFWVYFHCEQNLDGSSAEMNASAVQVLQCLTPSERRVALLVAEGCHNHDVARRLGKSPRTVDFQLNTIYRKLTISGRTELTRMLS